MATHTHHRHPPQKMKITSHGEVNRTFLLAVVIFVLVILTVTMLFFVQPVGKAITTGAGNSLDVKLEGNTLIVSANTIAEINGLYLELSSETTGFTLCDTAADVIVGSAAPALAQVWEFVESSCKNNIFNLGLATINDANFKTGPIEIARLTVAKTLPQPELKIRLNKIDVYETTGGADLFTSMDDTAAFTFSTTATGVVTPSTSSSSSSCSSGSGSGGFSCKRVWDCGDWSPCVDGKQVRSCVDKNGCSPTKIIRNKSYAVYVFGPEMPAATQICTGGTTTAQPTTPYVPPPYVQPIVEKPTPSAWEQYAVYILGIPAALLLIAAFALIGMHYFRPHHQYNYDELKRWIQEERTKGESENDIRKVLNSKTGWTKEEVDKIFKALGSR